MTKKFLIILVILIASQTQFCFAKIFNKENLPPIENPNDIPDPLAQYQIKDSAKGILQKITGEWKKINDKGTGWFNKLTTNSWTGKYAIQIKENIKQGLGEEKQEYRQDFFKVLGKLWERVKNFVFHR